MSEKTELANFLSEYWPWLAGILGIGGGAGGLKWIDRNQNMRIDNLSKKIEDADGEIKEIKKDLVDHKSKIAQEIAEMKLEVTLNGERDRHNQEIMIEKLNNICKSQDRQQATMDIWSKNMENFYYMNPDLKKPDSPPR